MKLRLNVTRASLISCTHVSEYRITLNGSSISEAIKNCYQPYEVLEYCILAQNVVPPHHIEVDRNCDICLRNYLVIYNKSVYLIHQVIGDTDTAEFKMTKHPMLNSPNERRIIMDVASSIIAAQY